MATFSEKLKRQWRHWTTLTAATRRAFPPEALAAITGAIKAGEQGHRSELRLIVETALPMHAIWHDATTRQRALALFAEYGVWDTADNCGVLIYVNLADRKVEIVADRMVDRVIGTELWQEACQGMTAGFAQGRFQASTLTAIVMVNALLREHFPSTGPRPNELPDQPVML